MLSEKKTVTNMFKRTNSSEITMAQHEKEKTINKEDNIFVENQEENDLEKEKQQHQPSIITTPKKQSPIQTQIKKNIKEQKVPENMKSFLKTKRTLSGIQISQKITKQYSIKSIRPQMETLNLTNDSLLQMSRNNIHQQRNKPVPYQQNLQNISISQNRSQNKNKQLSTNLICTICQGLIDQQMGQLFVFNCRHVFCLQCTKSYILYKIDRFELIFCPNQNCNEIINTESEFYENTFALKERKKYKTIERFYKKNNPNQKLCPFGDCQGVIKIDKTQDSVMCGSCKLQFCTKCYMKKHDNEQCKDYETNFMIKSLNLVQCEKCRNFIEKTEGCHHITCKCGYEFCEKCKQQWTKKHICKYTIFDRAEGGWGGCDWGLTMKDHFYFLIKIPLKVVLVIICTLFWIMFSFLGTPLNFVLLFYWLYLLLIKPSIEMIQNQQLHEKILIYVIFFPLMMIWNLSQGYTHLITHLQTLLPQIPNSYRYIIRL